MKFKTKLSLAAVGAALLLIGVTLFKQPHATSQASVHVTTASGTKAEKVRKPREVNAQTQVPEPQSPMVEGIQIIDVTNPAYNWPLLQLQETFRGTLRYHTRNPQVPDADIQKAIALLATARLSQMMYEATTAKIVESNAETVSVVVPAYAIAGDQLKEFIHKNLPRQLATPEFETGLVNEFGSFGTFPQQLEFQKAELEGDKRYYTIVCTTQAGAGIPLKTYSTLSLADLAAYTPFAGFLPKS